MTIYQGDIQFKKVESLPKGTKKKGNVVAYGEATGHKHQITGNAKVMIANDGRQFVVSEGCQSVHEEHGTVKMPKGIFFVGRQREADLVEGTRQVMD